MQAWLLSHVWLFATPWTVALQAPLSMGILQAKILERVAIFFSTGSSRFGEWTHISCVSCTGRQILYHSATWEALRSPPGSSGKAMRWIPHEGTQTLIRRWRTTWAPSLPCESRAAIDKPGRGPSPWPDQAGGSLMSDFSHFHSRTVRNNCLPLKSPSFG